MLLGPSFAQARAWKGINPGRRSKADVVQRFGEPTSRTKRGPRSVLAYYGEQALEGTRQAQFHVDGAGAVQEITIFLMTPLDTETIEGTYGKPTQKTFVEDTFQKVWIYPGRGSRSTGPRTAPVPRRSRSPRPGGARPAPGGSAPAAEGGKPGEEAKAPPGGK